MKPMAMMLAAEARNILIWQYVLILVVHTKIGLHVQSRVVKVSRHVPGLVKDSIVAGIPLRADHVTLVLVQVTVNSIIFDQICWHDNFFNLIYSGLAICFTSLFTHPARVQCGDITSFR